MNPRSQDSSRVWLVCFIAIACVAISAVKTNKKTVLKIAMNITTGTDCPDLKQGAGKFGLVVVALSFVVKITVTKCVLFGLACYAVSTDTAAHVDNTPNGLPEKLWRASGYCQTQP